MGYQNNLLLVFDNIFYKEFSPAHCKVLLRICWRNCGVIIRYIVILEEAVIKTFKDIIDSPVRYLGFCCSYSVVEVVM